jgi:site-specific recombinase XerD
MKERIGYKTPFLFVSSTTDRGLSSHGIKHWVNCLKKISGVNFHLHRFRHTFATNFLNSTHTNNNIVKLKELMGHRDIKMTQVYLRALPVDQMRADIEGMNLDNLI